MITIENIFRHAMAYTNTRKAMARDTLNNIVSTGSPNAVCFCALGAMNRAILDLEVPNSEQTRFKCLQILNIVSSFNYSSYPINVNDNLGKGTEMLSLAANMARYKLCAAQNNILSLIQTNDQNDDHFYECLKQSINILTIDVDDVAIKFDMAKPSVEKWLKNKNAPHPNMRKHVYEYLFSCCEASLNPSS